MPEFEVGLQTIRSGARMVRVTADDSLAARAMLQAECDAGQCDCPPEMCTDDVETTIRYVKQVALDDVMLITPMVSGWARCTPTIPSERNSRTVPDMSLIDIAPSTERAPPLDLAWASRPDWQA